MRIAVYLAPPVGHPLAEAADRWLGRRPDPPRLPGLTDTEWRDLIAEPSRYGFHATLKAPFALADGRAEADLVAAARAFAAARSPLEAPALALRDLAGFLALLPANGADSRLGALAGACVRAFEPFRAPLADADLARRRASGLSPDQDRNLVDWGYPYVFSEFRFHMTLTGRIADPARRAAVAEALGAGLAPALAQPLVFSDLCLFREPVRGAPFDIAHRLPFGGAVVSSGR